MPVAAYKYEVSGDFRPSTLLTCANVSVGHAVRLLESGLSLCYFSGILEELCIITESPCVHTYLCGVYLTMVLRTSVSPFFDNY